MPFAFPFGFARNFRKVSLLLHGLLLLLPSLLLLLASLLLLLESLLLLLASLLLLLASPLLLALDHLLLVHLLLHGLPFLHLETLGMGAQLLVKLLLVLGAHVLEMVAQHLVKGALLHL